MATVTQGWPPAPLAAALGVEPQTAIARQAI